MRWLFSKIKSLLKWGAIGIGVLAAIVIILGIFIQEDSNQKVNKPPKEQSVKEKEQKETNPQEKINPEKKTSSSSPSSNKNEKAESIKNDKSSEPKAQPVSYRIVESEDNSTVYGGEMAKRMSYSVVVGTEIKEEQVKPTTEEIISILTEENENIDAIWLFFYSTKSRVGGGLGFDVARAIWAPDGDMGKLTGRIARENVRKEYKIKLDVKEDLEGYLQKLKEKDNRFGFTEAERKDIFRELVRCEDKAEVQSSKYYDPMCSACPEYDKVEDWIVKKGNKSNEILKECEAMVREDYGITKDQQQKISVEGVEENWPMPDPMPYPDCCEY